MSTLTNRHFSDNQTKTLLILMWSVLAIVGMTMSFVIFDNWQTQQKAVHAKFEVVAKKLQQSAEDQLGAFIQGGLQDVTILASSPLLKMAAAEIIAVDTQSYQQLLKLEWINQIQLNPVYSQLRFIDAAGYEIFRIDQNDSEVSWKSGDDLQYKGNRDYFKKAIASDKDTFISKIDLNVEYGEVQVPHTPTIRIAHKVVFEDELTGIIIVNLSLREFFQNMLPSQSDNEYYLFNADGFFLAPSTLAWGAQLNTLNTMQTLAPSVWLSIKQQSLPQSMYGTDGWISPINLNLPEASSQESYYLWVKHPGSLAELLRKYSIYSMIVGLLTWVFIIAVGWYCTNLLLALAMKSQQAIAAADKAIKAERAKSTFLARMSHEIRTPMNGIFGLIQITETESNLTQVKTNMRDAKDSFELLKRVIDDILDFSKLEADKLTLYSKPFDTQKLLKTVGGMLSHMAINKSLDLWIDIDPDIPSHLIGDENRIKQVLFNLISNSIKFTNRGEVVIRLSVLDQDSKSVQIGFDVADTGIGMTQEEVSRVFSPFEQASEETAANFGGTGLGVSICKELVELMGGTISCESEYGRGTTFSFNLRLNRCSIEQDNTTFSPPPYQIHHALLLTENANARIILERQCRTLGWFTRSYQSFSAFEQALNELSKIPLKQIVIIIDGSLFSKSSWSAPLNEWAHHHADDESHRLLIIDHNDELHRDKVDSLKLAKLRKPITPSSLYDSVYGKMIFEADQHANATGEDLPLQNIRILLAEDNLVNQMVASTMLKGLGAEVDVAVNGSVVLDMLNSNGPFDIILMDMQMPVMGGIEATKAIRLVDKWQDLPIIALSANTLDEDRIRCIDAGMQDFASKPIYKDDILKAITTNLANVKTSSSSN